MKKIIILGLSLFIGTYASAFGVNVVGTTNTDVNTEADASVKIDLHDVVSDIATGKLKMQVEDGNGLEIQVNGKKGEKGEMHASFRKDGIDISVQNDENNVKISSNDAKIKVESKEKVSVVSKVELREDEKGKAYYSVKGKKKAKFLGLFNVNMNVEAKVDADNGEVVSVKTPWYSIFLF
jgi:uncharacterized membrane protein YkoI